MKKKWNKRVETALEQTINKWRGINEDFFEIRGKCGRRCALCYVIENCNQCIAQPLCNGQQDGHFEGKKTIWAKIDHNIDNLQCLLCDALEELENLRKTE